MQMHQIRYFLALCEERNFTRAAKRSGVSQPSLTNGIITLERELGGALFQRKPTIALTALGYAMQPYLARIAENADHAQRAAEALADRRAANAESATQESALMAIARDSGMSVRSRCGKADGRARQHDSIEREPSAHASRVRHTATMSYAGRITR